MKKNKVLGHAKLKERKCPQIIYMTLKDMAAKTGTSYYTTGTTTDSGEIPTANPGFLTMASPVKRC